MNYRKANIEDVNQLVELRKKQLIDEGCYSENNIDAELEKYFSSSIINEEIKNKGCKFARLHASSQGKKLYEKIGFVDAEGFMSKKL